jgi:ubiquinone/menaquinone biosynthesis C-methylase UbiE
MEKAAAGASDIQVEEGMTRYLEMDGYGEWRYALVSGFFTGARGRFLDVGCCTGKLAKQLPPGLEYQGVDGIANDFPGYTRIDLNGKRLPFPDGHFDHVSCTAVLEHLLYPLEMLREMKRVLKDDGTALISLPNDRGLNSILYAFSKVPSYDTQVYGHHWRFSIASAREFFGKEFEIIKEKAEFGPLYRRYLPFLTFDALSTEWFMLGRKPGTPRA